jgi:glucosamine--fructose-6-phosphate aminotransferase (isomerizing)
MKDYHFIQEVHEQPDVVHATLEHVDEQVKTIAQTYGERITRVVLVGCGDPYMLAVAASYAFEEWCGIESEAIEAAEFTMYRSGRVNAHTLVIPISSSGKSLTVLDAARLALDKGAIVIGLTNNVPSPLSEAVPQTLLTKAGKSDAYPSKQSTAGLAVLYALALALAEVKKSLSAEELNALRTELNETPERMRRTLELEGQIATLAAQFVDVPIYTFLGCGPNLGTAQLSAAKMIETSQSRARATNVEEFSHLHGYVLGKNEPVFVLNRGGSVSAQARRLAPNLRSNGAQVLVLGPADDAALWKDSCDLYIPLEEHNEMFGPLVAWLPLQLFAYHIALQKGRNPDKPDRVGSDYIQQIIYGGMLEGYEKR